ncbi:MAG: D-alanyl-D-alanine endopeptidase [Betaproteobacteria bacterium]|nr:D-alanyl-D-alanine endopeptidase [Betaproteobacteria bacterium]
MVLSTHKCVLGLFVVLGLSWGPVALAQSAPPVQAAPAAKASAKKPGTEADRRAQAAAPAKKKAEAAGKKASASSSKRVKAAAAVGAAGAVAAVAARPSMGQTYGLHQTPDPLDLKSSVALVLDRNTNEVLFSKNAQAVLPIASITKLMTSMVVFEQQQDLDEVLIVTQDDVDTEKNSGSRLAVGSRLTRREMLHLALMSSENRAAHALGRHYPGGMPAFVDSMNHRARELGMHDTRFVEPTGLSSKNQSSAHDLAILVRASHEHELLRQFSVMPEAKMAVGRQQLQFRNTNGLVRGGTWDIALQKTGYIAEAGRCVVMQATLAGRELILVLLDSAGRYSRIGDAERLRKWITEHAAQGSPAPEKSPARSLVAG